MPYVVVMPGCGFIGLVVPWIVLGCRCGIAGMCIVVGRMWVMLVCVVFIGVILGLCLTVSGYHSYPTVTYSSAYNTVTVPKTYPSPPLSSSPH